MKRWLIMGSGVLLLALSIGLWAVAQEAAPKPEAKTETTAAGNADEMGYWDKFKLMFVDWDDDKHQEQTSGKTEVVGLRGVNIEQAMGSGGYDWQGLRRVEDYRVAPDQVKSFLKQGKLGPYR